MGCHALLQAIFPTQGLSLHLCIAGRFFTTEPPGKPKGMTCLSAYLDGSLYCSFLSHLKHSRNPRFYYKSKILFVVVVSRSVLSDSLRVRELSPARPLCPWDFPGKNTGMGCHFLLQGISPPQGWNPRLLHWLEGWGGWFFTTEPPVMP